MIYICTAMYMEAAPFISKLDLKKDTSITKFQVFKNDAITLFITGKGAVKSAIAVTYILCRESVSSSDILINIGLCGSATNSYKIGQTLLINKITDRCTKRTYYPDIILNHPFKECSIETFPIEADSNSKTESSTVDMESSGIYQSAITFLQPHQIIFIKIVSDYLKPDGLSISSKKDLLSEPSEIIADWIMRIKDTFSTKQGILSPKEIETIDKISESLKFSCTMKNELKQIIKYSDLMHHDSEEYLSSLLKIKCSIKKEGLSYLEEIRKKLI